jgi:LacI family transcriptional regulator, galactose operon repressor
MPATIRDVALASGVHISTVSRTFSAPHLVNADTRTRVLACAEQLGYRPNRAARALITGRTCNLGLIVADIANPFFPPLIKAAESQARKHDHLIFVADTNEDAAVEEDLVRALAKQVDGVLLCSPRMTDERIAELSRDVPLVVVNRQIAGLPAVVMDVAHGARLAIEHLTGLGHRALGLITGPRSSWTSKEIRRTAAAAARAASAELLVIGPNQPTEDGGLTVAEQVVAHGLTAVLTYNDLIAVGLMEGLYARGLRVPRDVSVVGIDDIALSRLTRPKLTTVATPTAAAGRAAVDMLLAHGDDRRTTAHLTLQTDLVIRDSTGPAPGRRPAGSGDERDPGPHSLADPGDVVATGPDEVASYAKE